jgi:hypothetical protein
MKISLCIVGIHRWRYLVKERQAVQLRKCKICHKKQVLMHKGEVKGLGLSNWSTIVQ